MRSLGELAGAAHRAGDDFRVRTPDQRHALDSDHAGAGNAGDLRRHAQRAAPRRADHGGPAADGFVSGAGCNSRTPPPTKTTAGKTTPVAPTSTAVVESACEGTLSSIDDIFKLSRLGRTTSIADGVLRLNDWQRSCMPSEADAQPALP